MSKSLPVPKGPVGKIRPAARNLNEKLEEIGLKFRFLFVIPFLLVPSFLFKQVWNVRDYVIRTIGANFRNHDKTVRYVQAQIKAWKSSGSKQLLCTARSEFLSV